MLASARFVVASERERSILQSARSDPPFSVRECSGRVLIASSAAAPVGGDTLELDAHVRAGVHAHVGSVAAMVVLPGPAGEPSSLRTSCVVESGGHLDWHCEPSVSVTGSDHTASTRIHLASDATCCFVEEVSLGRSNEPAGTLRIDLRVERGGTVVVHHGETFGPRVPGAGSSVSVGDARHVLSAVLVGVAPGQVRVEMGALARGSWLPMGEDVVVVLAVGSDRPAVTSLVRSMAPELGL